MCDNNMPYTLVSDTEVDDQADLKADAKRKRSGGSPTQDDKLKKQCLSSSGPDNLSLLPAELKSQIFFEVSDRGTLLNLSQVSKVFRAVFDGRKREFFFSAYAEELRRGEVTCDDAANAITKYTKEEPKAALMLFEATWKGLFNSNIIGPIRESKLFTEALHRRWDTQDYDTLILSLHTMYDHVVLEPSWAAWAGAITAIKCLRYHSEKGDIISIRMEPWILHQIASVQREIIDQGVLYYQEATADCVLDELQRYHKMKLRREEERHLEWKHLERKKKHIDNLAEVLQAMVVDFDRNNEDRWVQGYRQVEYLMLLEGSSPLGCHADFHGGVQSICEPSTCRHTADADNLFCALEEICSNLITVDLFYDACQAIRVFGRVPPYYKHIAAEPLGRSRRLLHDEWPSEDLG